MKHTKEKKAIVSVGYLCPMRKIMKNECFREKKKRKPVYLGAMKEAWGEHKFGDNCSLLSTHDTKDSG